MGLKKYLTKDKREQYKKYAKKTLEVSKEGLKKLESGARNMRDAYEEKDERYGGGLGLFK